METPAGFPPLPPSEIPSISALLLREAHAWAALLSLHNGVLQQARALGAALGDDAALAEQRDAAEQREAALVAALTQLASGADMLASEALKLRTLRKSRHLSENSTVELLLRPHSAEVTAVASSLLQTGHSGVVAATAELRKLAAGAQQQTKQIDALADELRAISSAPAAPAKPRGPPRRPIDGGSAAAAAAAAAGQER